VAFSFNGFGTTYYGARDYRADSSYITTEWKTSPGHLLNSKEFIFRQ